MNLNWSAMYKRNKSTFMVILGLFVVYFLLSKLYSLTAETKVYQKDSNRVGESKLDHQSKKLANDYNILIADQSAKQLVDGYNDVPVVDKDTEQAPNTNVEPVKVLLNGYMRSGSSFVGRMLGWRNDSFYVYEPLMEYNLWTYLKEPEIICDTKFSDCKKISKYSSNPSSFQQTQLYLQDLFHCKLDGHPDRFQYNQVKELGWKPYQNCVQSKENQTFLEFFRGEADVECLKLQSKACKLTTNRVVKVLRLSLNTTKSLLETLPRLKVVHLFRDPRAILNSRIHSKFFFKKKKKESDDIVNSTINSLCSRILNDIQTGKQLKRQFPDTFKLIQYEDFADPYTQVRMLNTFLGMNLTQTSHEFIRENALEWTPLLNTGSKLKPGFHPFSYRATLPWKYILMLNTHCSIVYKELGLVKFNTENDLRNETISTVKSKLPFAIN